MLKRATQDLDLRVFSDLPVTSVQWGRGGTSVAVHCHGTLDESTIPVVCLPGYIRNMSDFASLAPALNRLPETGFCFILLDLPGRGRSNHLPGATPYSSPADARAVIEVCDALDIPRAVIMGEGHGGQVGMLVALERPGLVGGTVLIDAGPVTDPRSLVRARNNHRHISGLKSRTAARTALHKILSADYPGEPEANLDALAARLYSTDAKGRLVPLFDPRLIAQLEQFDFDDALEPQWPLFDCLVHAPLMLVRTQLSDQLRRSTFEEMVRRRPDAATLTISGQGSPALLDGSEERDAIAAFLRDVCAA